jgi:hypothetical protein
MFANFQMAGTQRCEIDALKIAHTGLAKRGAISFNNQFKISSGAADLWVLTFIRASWTSSGVITKSLQSTSDPA